MKKLIFLLILSLGTYTSTAFSNSFPNPCFIAKGKTYPDAQEIRKIASDMGWKVGRYPSIKYGSLIRGEKIIYPQDKVDVCLKNSSDGLYIKIQSLASNAKVAEYIKISAKPNAKKSSKRRFIGR
jgi:hypothetical protein